MSFSTKITSLDVQKIFSVGHNEGMKDAILCISHCNAVLVFSCSWLAANLI